MADIVRGQAARPAGALQDDLFELIVEIYNTINAPERWPTVYAHIAVATDAPAVQTVVDLCRRQILASWAEPRDSAMRVPVNGDGERPSTRAPVSPAMPEDPAALLSLYAAGLPARARRMVESLLPHVEQASRLDLELREARLALEAAQQVMERLCLGVLLVDQLGQVCFSNPGARQLLAARDGLWIQEGEIRAREPDETRQLARLVRQAVHHNVGGALALNRPSGRQALQVIVAPLSRSEILPGLERTMAALFVSDPEVAPGGCAEALERMYGLTPCEARVAQGVVTGRGLQEVADGIGVGLNTVRTHLQHVFQKTGTRRQAELTQLLLRGPLQLHLKASSFK